MTSPRKVGAKRLPPGLHGFPRELVARNQRERLIAAMAEACWERGFAEVTVTDIVKRAGVSNVTFYERFESKQACLLAAHEELFGRLLEGLGNCGGGEDGVRAAIREALVLLAADPPSARLLTVEVLAAGPAGMARQDAAIGGFADRLGISWTHAIAMAMLVGRLVMAGQALRLPELEDELVALAMNRTGGDR